VLADDRHLLTTAPTTGATEALLASLRANPDVLWAERDYIRHRTGDPVTPSDPLFPQQWALPLIRAPQAWSRTTGSTAVTVAIIDTGWVQHPELVDRVVGGYDFITDPLNAGDGDGRDADPTDYGDSTDQSSGLHGTHVAGIIGATSNNAAGVAGLDWNCRLLIVRTLGIRKGTGIDSDIADAIRWAAGLHVNGVPDNAHPAAVLNLSFGGTGYSQSMQDAIHDAVGAVAIVVAAGNEGIDAKSDSPAGLDGVIAVGAVDNTGQQAGYSNFGSAVALMAPGGSPLRDPTTGQPMGVISTIELVGSGFTYTYYAGTSQAAPFVSATASLMKGVYPHMDAAGARHLLTASADPSAQCRDPNDPTQPGCGAGLLDVDAALVLTAQAAIAAGDGHANNIVHGGYGCSIVAGAGGAAPSSGALALLLLVAVAGLRRRML
jgi:serine protease